MISAIVHWLQNLIALIGPFGVAVATFVESFFAPIPSEVILITAGTVAEDKSQVLIYAIFATIGSYLGTLIFYFIGRKSHKYVIWFFGKYGKFFFISVDEILYAEDKFREYGKPIVFFGRLIPIIRSLISIPAGMAKMDFKIYTIYTLAGSFIWNTLLISFGYAMKDKTDLILEYLDRYQKLVIVLLLLAIIVYIIYRVKQKKKS